jgi:hypothetical protein
LVVVVAIDLAYPGAGGVSVSASVVLISGAETGSVTGVVRAVIGVAAANRCGTGAAGTDQVFVGDTAIAPAAVDRVGIAA